MAKIPNKVKKILEQYLTALKANNIPVKQAILFGSYARGEYGQWSDIDIALVSEIFEGNRMDDRSKIREITLSVSSDLEVLPYHPKDFTPADPFVREILRTGIRIV